MTIGCEKNINHNECNKWNTFRGNIQHTGYYCGNSPKELTELKWKFKTKGKVWSSPVISDGMVFFGSDDQYLYAVDMKTGQEKWKFKTKDDVVSSPAISDVMVFFGSNDHYLYTVK